jgi:hypothetical protein
MCVSMSAGIYVRIPDKPLNHAGGDIRRRCETTTSAAPCPPVYSRYSGGFASSSEAAQVSGRLLRAPEHHRAQAAPPSRLRRRRYGASHMSEEGSWDPGSSTSAKQRNSLRSRSAASHRRRSSASSARSVESACSVISNRIDLEHRKAVDLLPDREVSSFADWLRAHPGAEFIGRDTAGSYVDEARLGAPEAVQS